jgi:hypothetical protein
VYATNGVRPALAFCVNGVPMGGELELGLDDELTFSFEAVLDGYYDRAELLQGGEVLWTFRGETNQIHHVKETYTARPLPGTTAYYLRVYQTDGGVAWASPVWVTAKHARR